jgi:phage-related protein (TIGR01555 family)
MESECELSKKKPQATIDKPKAPSNILTMDAFMNAMARIGFNQPNLLEQTQYPMTRMSKDFNLLNSLFRGHWIVKRIIDTIAEDMTKNWYQVQSQIPPDDIKKIAQLERRISLRTRLVEGLRWGRLYGGAVGVMMIKGHEEHLEEELDYDYVMPGSFMGLLILDRWSGVYPMLELVDDISNPEFGLPKYYSITAEEMPATIVHHSRIVRFTGRDLPQWEKQMEMHWGASELEHVFDELKKRDNTSWNIANMVYG